MSETNVEEPTTSYLFKPRLGIVFKGSFYMAMEEAAAQGKWLLINVQSENVFRSHLLNRDIWSDNNFVEVITSHFLFWQVDNEERDGEKVACFYKLSSFPAIMVIDPVTGEKKWACQRTIDASSLLCDLMPFADSRPCEEYKHLNIECAKHDQEEEATNDQYYHHYPTHETTTSSITPTGWGEEFDNEEEFDEIGDGWNLDEYPTLSEEPVDQNRDMVCKVGIRLPDGRRVQRMFNKSDPIQLLWSFGHTVLDEEAKNRPFRFVEAVPGRSRTLEYEQERTFDEEQLNNTMLYLTLND